MKSAALYSSPFNKTKVYKYISTFKNELLKLYGKMTVAHKKSRKNSQEITESLLKNC